MPPPGSKLVRNCACVSAARHGNPAEVRSAFKRCGREEHPQKEDATHEREGRRCQSNIAPHKWLLQIGFESGFGFVSGELETEGMAAPQANVFGPRVACVVDRDVVTKHHTFQGMPDYLEIRLCFDERVPASACVFGCGRAFFDYVNAMAQESTYVVNFLFEFVVVGMWIGTRLEQQRVATFFADVLIVLCPLPDGDVVVPAEKAGKRMSDAGGRWAPIKNCRTASSARSTGVPGNSRVIDFVAQQCAFG